MARSRIIPVPPVVDENADEFQRAHDFSSQSGSPRDFARKTAQGWSEGGQRSQVKSPEQ